MSWQRLDEDDVRTRPGRGSKARSRLRPKHVDAVDGVVVGVDRGRFACLVEGHEVVAMRAGELRRTSVVVGDRVSLVGEVAGGPDALARIVRVAPRTSILRRTADDADPVERPIVANADQLVVVVALADPPPRSRLIDRCLVAAYDGGLTPLLCLTKRDLATPDRLLAAYEPFGVPAVAVMSKDPDDVAALRGRLIGRTSVLVGHSGVGKSTLVNALIAGAGRATGHVSEVGRGRHTSSSVIALPLAAGGWLVDTPGVRSFGLGHMQPERVLAAFPDLAAGLADCPRGCAHTEADAEECGLDALVRQGRVDPARLASYRRLLSSREDDDETD